MVTPKSELDKLFNISLSDEYLEEKAYRAVETSLHYPASIFFDLTKEAERVKVLGLKEHQGRTYALARVIAPNTFSLPGLKEAIWLRENTTPPVARKYRVCLMHQDNMDTTTENPCGYKYLLVRIATLPLEVFERSHLSCQ